jgi:predicted RND superfamily exporter protein
LNQEPHIPYFQIDPFPVVFGIATSKKAFDREIKRLDIHLNDLSWSKKGARTNAFVSDSDEMCIIVSIDTKAHKQSPPELRANIYAHEAVHVFQYVMEHVGEDEPGKEVEAYVIGRIVEQIHEHIESKINT